MSLRAGGPRERDVEALVLRDGAHARERGGSVEGLPTYLRTYVPLRRSGNDSRRPSVRLSVRPSVRMSTTSSRGPATSEAWSRAALPSNGAAESRPWGRVGRESWRVFCVRNHLASRTHGTAQLCSVVVCPVIFPIGFLFRGHRFNRPPFTP